MNQNEQTMQRFYTAFSNLDATTMIDCYSDDPIFNDPVFGILQGEDVKAMWNMLCDRAKDFSLEFSNIKCDEEYGTCNWTATYVFTKTGKKVVNHVKAHMRFHDGKIIEHTDEFSFYKWARQALGLRGTLLGWTSVVKIKVRRQAHQQLRNFMGKHYNGDISA
jgi:ketosteroid isomerase-like protein